MNVFGAQYYIVEQLGFRKIVDTTFMMGFLLARRRTWRTPNTISRRCVTRSRRSICNRRLQAFLRARAAVGPAGPGGRAAVWTGERIVFEPYTRDLYERTQKWMQVWDLFSPEQAQEATYETAVLV